MSSIQELLAQILSARYGKDVRQSIHDSIEMIDQIAEGAEKSATASAKSASESAQRASDASAQTIAEVKAYADATEKSIEDLAKSVSGKVGINDAVVGIGTTWSSEKIDTEIGTQSASGESHALITSEGGVALDKVEGKLVKSPNLLKPTLATTTTSGVTCTNNGDGTYTLNGTATENAQFLVVENIKLKNGVTYNYFVYNTADIVFGSYGKNASSASLAYDFTETINTNRYFTPKEDIDINSFFFRVVKGKTVNNLIIKPMLTTDTSLTYADFMPYGIHSSGDMGCVCLGDLDWTKFQNGIFQTDISSIGGIPNATDVYCNEYTYSTSGASGTFYFGSTKINVYDSRYTDAVAFTNAMKSVFLCYEVAEGATPSQYGIALVEHGNNIWNEQWRQGIINANTGAYIPYANDICSAEFIKVKPNTTYFGTSSGSIAIKYFDIDKNPIKSIGFDALIQNATFTTTSNTVYIKFRTVDNGGTYNNDIAIIEGTSGKYVPYAEDTTIIPLDAPLANGDFIDSDKVHREMGKVDLGDLSWTRKTYAGVSYFATTISDIVNYPASTNITFNMACDKYSNMTTNTISQFKDKQISSYNKEFYVRDDSYTDATAFKTAMQGVMLYYELATPTDTPLSTDQKIAMHSLVAYDGKTFIESADAYAKPTLSVRYGTTQSLALECYNKNAILEANIDKKIAELQALTLEL